MYNVEFGYTRTYPPGAHYPCHASISRFDFSKLDKTIGRFHVRSYPNGLQPSTASAQSTRNPGHCLQFDCPLAEKL